CGGGGGRGWEVQIWVDRRIDQQLKRQRWLPGVTGLEGHRCGKVATRAVAADTDLDWVDIELTGVLDDPLEGGEAVVQRRRKSMFGRLLVVDGHDHAAGGVGQASTWSVGDLKIAGGPSAAVKIDKTWEGSGPVGGVDADVQLRRRAGDVGVFHSAYRLRITHELQPVPVGCTHLCHRRVRDGLAATPLEQLDHVPRLRVQCHRTSACY